ncbi:helix-turn-helix domain-containing protein [Labrys neptuniae]
MERDFTRREASEEMQERPSRPFQKNATSLQIDWKRFGEDLRHARAARGLTYRQFGALTGVTFSTLARLESSYLPCNAETFMTLAVEMGRDPLAYAIRANAAAVTTLAREIDAA